MQELSWLPCVFYRMPSISPENALYLPSILIEKYLYFAPIIIRSPRLCMDILSQAKSGMGKTLAVQQVPACRQGWLVLLK